MSLKSFLSKIWAEVKSLFDGIPAELKNAISIGVVITEGIKTFVDSPAADVLTVIIPGTLDDDLKTLLRAKLPEILTELKLADSCSGLTDPSQSSFLHSLSILIAQVAADGKLTWSDGVYILQWHYQHEFQTVA